MKPSTLLSLLTAHAKAATVAVVAVGATAGGGLAVATTVADSHATTGLTTAASQQAPDSNVTDTQAPTPTDSSEATDAAVTTTTDQSPAACPSGIANHGAYVSSVAKTKPSPGASPGSHGAAVSAAARSDCGKPSPDASESEDSGTPSAHPSHPAHPSPASTHGQAGKHGHGH